MRPLFAFSMLLAGLWMTNLAPTASLQSLLPKTASGNTCDFGDPLVAASCANVNGNRGLLGRADYGAYGYHHTGSFGYLGGNGIGAYGRYSSGPSPIGYLGSANYGAFGSHQDGLYGWLGSANYGAYGQHNNGNFGHFGSQFYGVYGEHINGPLGYLGGGSAGAVGEHQNGNFGTLGSGSYGAYGRYNNGNTGILGGNIYGVRGDHINGNYGTLGTTGFGALGVQSNGNYGILGRDDAGVWGTGSPWAGYFDGNVHVTGTLTQGNAASKVDHPLDPANRYLSHAFVESPDMMNVYNGNTVLDAQGEAVVELPSYFEALNGDFRYQLTCLGGFAPVYVAEEITGNRFKIAGGTSGMKVSWQVTGIRHDPWAEQNRIVVEEAKPAAERGFYLHPGLYGASAERGIEWARDPEGMRAMQQMPAQIEEERRQMQEERQQMDEEHQLMQAEHERIRTEREDSSPRPDNHR